MPKPGLSKSRILAYLQCPKRLYLSVHHPELEEESADATARFQAGHQVGALAQAMYPDGILIGGEQNDLSAALAETRLVLRDHPDKPLFEATFEHEGTLVRADLLLPEKGGYRMVEVKSSTSVKDYYLADCAVQRWVTEKNGVELTGVGLMHIDNQFVYPGGNLYRGLLTEADVTEVIHPMVEQVPGWIAAGQQILAGEIPDVETGDQCSNPYSCFFYRHCSAGEPEYPVSLLPGKEGKSIARELKVEGFRDLREVPPERLNSPQLQKILRVTVSGQAEVDPEAADALAILPYPRYYLDFETIQFAVPIWVGTRPYQQLPFQWSCHIERAPGELEHLSFLDISGGAPMRGFAESLIDAMGNDGPILVYNQGFENARIRELAIMFPDLAERLASLTERVVDLLPIARQHYYHPAMKGSWSIKAVLPTIAPELDYSALAEVQDGGMAQAAFLEAIEPGIAEIRRENLRHALLEYCQLDTLAMVRLAHFFRPARGEKVHGKI